MKTATVRELRNQYTELLRWIEAGEEVLIRRKGVVVAKLVPEIESDSAGTVSWERSPVVRRDRSGARCLGEQESAAIRSESQGAW